MEKKSFLFVAVTGFIILIGGGVWYFTNIPSPTPIPTQVPVPTQLPKTNIITYTDAGFFPSSLAIKMGDTVTFKNESSVLVWPASAMHPMHMAYPGSNIDKCGTADEPKIFDACRGFTKGQNWSFQFNSKGTWGYHDHLHASKWGTIVVE